MSDSGRRPTETRNFINRRQLGLGVAASVGSLAIAGGLLARDTPARELVPRRDTLLQRRALAMDISASDRMERVIPRSGMQTRTRLGDSPLKLVEHGIIDPDRFLALYHNELPPEQRLLLFWPSHRPINLMRENSNIYVNLLWPLGRANRLKANESSPVNNETLPMLAATAGWTLGQAENGAACFNGYRILDLSERQEQLAASVAQRTYRPCCDNSTFLQDCNHGSALFGILQLGAAQGLGGAELFQEALTFNSFWFPSHYVQIALYLELIEKTGWADADPARIMGAEYSASSPSRHKLSQIAGTPELPLLQSAISCGA